MEEEWFDSTLGSNGDKTPFTTIMQTKQIKPEDIKEAIEGAEVLVPDMNADRKLAIVSLDVLQYLASLLPKADFYRIKRDCASQIQSSVDMEAMIQVLTQQLDFHASVNLVKVFFASHEMVEPETVRSKTESFDKTGN